MFRGNGRASRRGYYTRYLAFYAKRNLEVLLLGGLFVLGVLLGTLLLKGAGEESVQLLERLMGGFVERRRGAGLYENFLSAAGSSLLFVGGIFVCGFCAVAQPVIVLAPLIRGMGFGFSAASLFARHGASAAGFVGALLLPGTLFSTVAVLLCCKQALRLSATFFATVRPAGSKAREPHSLREYFVAFGLSALICLAGAFLEAALYILFANSFILG